MTQSRIHESATSTSSTRSDDSHECSHGSHAAGAVTPPPPSKGGRASTGPRISPEQRRANDRLRALLKERDTVGLLEFERLQNRRKRAANLRVRAHTAAVVSARLSATNRRGTGMSQQLTFEDVD